MRFRKRMAPMAAFLMVSCLTMDAYAIVPDTKVSPGTSIEVNVGDIVEINCSDLIHAGIYSEEVYDSDVGKMLEKLASSNTSSFSNYDDAIRYLTAKYGNDPGDSAGLEKEKKREAIASREDFDRVVNKTDPEINGGADDSAARHNEDLKRAVESALDAAKKTKENDDWITRTGWPHDHVGIDYDGGAKENAIDGIRDGEKTASGNGNRDQEGIQTRAGDRVMDLSGAEYTPDGLTVTDSNGKKHAFKKGYYPINAENDGNIEYLDAALIMGERLDENGNATGDSYKTRAVVPAKRCSVCGQYYTCDTPCACGREGTVYADQTPKYLAPAPLSYTEDGRSCGITGEYDKENAKVYLSLSGDDDVWFPWKEEDQTQTVRSESEAAVTYRCSVCGEKIDLYSSYSGHDDSNPYMITGHDGSTHQVCTECYKNMSQTTQSGLMMDIKDLAHTDMFVLGDKYTGVAFDSEGNHQFVTSETQAGKCVNGYHSNDGAWHYYIDGNTTKTFVTACKISDLEDNALPDDYENDLQNEADDVISDIDDSDTTLDPGDIDFPIVDPDDIDPDFDHEQDEQESEIDDVRDEIEDTIDDVADEDHTDPDNVNPDPDAGQAIVDELSDAEETIVDPNGNIEAGNETAQEIATDFHNDVTRNGWEDELQELIDQGVIIPGSTSAQTIEKLKKWIEQNSSIHNSLKEDSSVRCQHITTTKTMNPVTNVQKYVTSCTLYITDQNGQTVAQAQYWNGGSLFWTAPAEGTYKIVREVKCKNVVRSVLVTTEKYSATNEGESEPFYEHEVITAEDSTSLKNALSGGTTSTYRAAPITVRVKKRRIELSVNDQSFTTERLW